MERKDISVMQVNTCDKGGGGASKIAWYLFSALCKDDYNAKFLTGYKKSLSPDSIPLYNNYGTSRQRFFGSIDKNFDTLFGRIKGSFYIRKALHYLAEPNVAKDVRKGFIDYNFSGTQYLAKATGVIPTIIHLHNMHGGYFDLRALPILSKRSQILWTLHDEWAFTGICGYTYGCRLWETGCGKCPQIGNGYPLPDATAKNWYIKKDVYKNSEIVICAPSKWLIDKAKKSILNAREYHHIPNGIDLTVFKPLDKREARRALNIDPEGIVILNSGYMAKTNPRKDYETTRKSVLAAAAKLSRKKVTLICMGSKGRTENYGNLQVIFIPYLNDDNIVAKYYQASDVYMHTADAENFPLTIMEACACGIPVVATDVGGVKEQITDGETGFLVPTKAPEVTGNQVIRILSDNVLARKVGEAAAKKATKFFGLGHMINSYKNLYENLSVKKNVEQ